MPNSKEFEKKISEKPVEVLEKKSIEIQLTENLKPSELSVAKQYKPWQFKKGVSGNPAGKPKGTFSLSKILVREIKKKSPEERETFAVRIVKELISDAIHKKNYRKIEAIKTIFAYTDGLPTQRIESDSIDNFVRTILVRSASGGVGGVGKDCTGDMIIVPGPTPAQIENKQEIVPFVADAVADGVITDGDAQPTQGSDR